MAGFGGIEPAGSQRAIGSLPVPRDRRHFLSSLTWKLYGASHLWLRPFLASCLSSSRSRQPPALPAHPQPLCPAGSYRPPTKANPEGTPPFRLTVPAPVSFAAPSGSILVCFHATEESPIPGRTAEPPGAGDTAGSLSLPTLGAGAGAGQRCWARPGARDVLGEGRASAATLSSVLVVQPCLCLSLAPAALPMVTSCLSTVLLFLLCFPFFSLFLNTLSALSDLALLFPAGWGAAAGRWTPGAAQGDLCITQREALGSCR